MDQNTQPTTGVRNDVDITQPGWKKEGYEDSSSRDAVFGEITEEGPDYRSVNTFSSSRAVLQANSLPRLD